MNTQVSQAGRRRFGAEIGFGRVMIVMALLVLWWGAPAVQATLAQDRGPDSVTPVDPRLQDAGRRYGFDSWPSGKTYNGVDLAGLAFAGYRKEGIEFSGEPRFSERFRDASGKFRFVVELAVRETPRQARLALLACLAHVSSIRPVPSTASLALPVGEVGYVGPSRGNRISWIAFVRGNIWVRIACLDPRADPHPDMRSVARAVDALVARQPTLATGKRLTRPAVSLAASSTSCHAGEVIDLDVPAAAAALDWVVGGPGQGYVEQDEMGRWQLHTTGPGAIELRLDVLGSNGVTAATRIKLQVDPE